eukprot:1749_1
MEEKILNLLEREYEETEFTDNKLPEVILNELTKEFEKPKLARISKKELYDLLQSNTKTLMPFANLLNYWTVDDDNKLQNELNEMHKQQNVNYVYINKNQQDEKQYEITKQLNDNDLMDIMYKEYLKKYKNNENEMNK